MSMYGRNFLKGHVEFAALHEFDKYYIAIFNNTTCGITKNHRSLETALVCHIAVRMFNSKYKILISFTPDDDV